MRDNEPLSHEQIHRQIAEALAALVSEDPATPPHPYISRYLAQHAARGHVLDDDHVPPSLLPWETTTTVRRLLQQQTRRSTNQDWLKVWASIEPFIGEAGPVSRMTSLHLAWHAARHRRQTLSCLPADIARHPGSRATPLWSDCAPPTEVWAIANPPVRAFTYCAPAADGSRPAVIVSGDEHGLIRSWRPDGTAAAAPLPLHDGAVTHLLTLDKRLVASAGSDGRLCISDVLRGGIVEYRRPATWISSLILFKPTSSARLLLAAHSDGHIAAYNTATFRPVPVALPELDDGPVLLAVTGQPGRDEVLICAQRSAVSRWDGRKLTLLDRRKGPIRALAGLSQPGRFVTSDPVDGLSFYDTGRPGEPLASIPQRHTVTALLPVTLENGPGLAAGSSDGTVQLWNEEDHTPVGGPFRGHTAPITALALFTGKSRNRLLSAAADGIVRNWPLDDLPPAAEPRPWEPLAATALLATAPPGAGPRLAVASGSTLDLWNLAEGSSRHLPFKTRITALHWVQSRLGTHLAVALSDATIQVYRQSPVRQQLRLVGRLAGHHSPATAMASSTVGARTVLGSISTDGTVRLWDLADMNAITTFGDHKLSVLCIDAMTSDGALFASGGADGKVRLWDAAIQSQHGPAIRCDQHAVLDVAFAPSTAGAPLEVATAGEDGSLKTWDLSDGSPRKRLDLWQPDGPLSAVTWFTTSRQRLALAAASRSRIHVWDALTGDHLLEVISGRTVTSLSAHQLPDSPGRHGVLVASGESGVAVFALHLENL